MFPLIDNTGNFANRTILTLNCNNIIDTKNSPIEQI